MTLTQDQERILARFGGYGQHLIRKWVDEGATFDEACDLYLDWEQGEIAEYKEKQKEIQHDDPDED